MKNLQNETWVATAPHLRTFTGLLLDFLRCYQHIHGSYCDIIACLYHLASADVDTAKISNYRLLCHPPHVRYASMILVNPI